MKKILFILALFAGLTGSAQYNYWAKYKSGVFEDSLWLKSDSIFAKKSSQYIFLTRQVLEGDEYSINTSSYSVRADGTIKFVPPVDAAVRAILTTQIGSVMGNALGTTINGQPLSGTMVINSTGIPEGSNLYYTDARARSSISLTTTGTSGAATYNPATGVLNVPNYITVGGATWGSITGTLPSQSDLQAALNLKVNDADVKGGAVNLNARLGTISNFASPNAGGVVAGQYYDNSFQGTASSTLAGVANRIDLAPYYTSVNLPIDRIGVAVSTAVASAQGKVVIYSCDANGWPDALLYESAALDFSVTGIAEATLSFTFSSGVQYWVGVRHSSTATLRTINVSSAVNLGLTSSTASNYATVLRRTVTFASGAPNPWVFTNSDRVANITPPSIRFRAQ